MNTAFSQSEQKPLAGGGRADVARFPGVRVPAPSCDACGRRDPEAVFHDETRIVLCWECFSYLTTRPSFTHETIKRRSAGNDLKPLGSG